ncbi:hypothetical protein TSUD_294460 [Trifolium subterraneum]|uniref:Uncharacterized protein n=1 Tax=Trifolium subterraneum TaxID=3900 RepID=A0A2Z6NB26_TRISU|nr:hypothetical protein TSUD_294460 [Trifolium subterraneum]
MKFVCSSLTLSFLLFAFLTNLSPSFSFEDNGDDGRYIIATNRIPIHPDGRYYIIPSFMGIRSGGIKLEKTGNSNCPVTVLEEDFTSERGLAVKFNIIGTSYDILTGSPIGIEFLNKPNCVESSKWLIFVDNVIKKSCVGIGGPENYPGMKTLNGTFLIRNAGVTTYKFVFCENGSSTSCSDIRWYNNFEGGGRLSLTGQYVSYFVFVETYSYEDEIMKSIA